ncbi:MAG TPA: class I SAM-dependent methyltransferase [Candidatus Binatia bacterium]|jgi:hypothetical protein
MLNNVGKSKASVPWVHRKKDSCRACGDKNLQRFLCLGPTPLANSFLRSPDDFTGESSYPLDVYFCKTCSLVQLLDVINPEVLFRNYVYVTGTSETIAEHNVRYAQTVVDLLELQAKDLVVEVASNDGSLLGCFKDHGVKILGVEPATNIAEMARARGIETANHFFDLKIARELRGLYGPAKAVIGNNVLAHVDETRDFLRGCKELIDEDGLVIIEVPYLRDLIDGLEYDTIYHEHLCYFLAHSLKRLCDVVGLSIVRIDRVPIHGGSLRMYAGLCERYGKRSDEFQALVEEERSLGLTEVERYHRFAFDVEKNRQAILALLGALQKDGKTVAGYGAPAKGNTLLNYCRIGTDLLPYTVDKNPLKIGLYTPGMHIPVLPVSTLLERQPDYVLILPWNFADEIIKQQAGYQARGGRFIIPMPEPRLV